MEKELSDKLPGSVFTHSIAMVILLWLISGCAKDGGVCVSTTGQITQQKRNLPYFNQIDLRDNVSLIISNDTGNQVLVEAGQNIIDGVKTEVADGQLIISNNNTCNWLRDYNKPLNVYISGNKIWKITYNSSGDIVSNGTLKLDSINLQVWGGCGTIDLSLDIWQGSFSLNLGTVDLRLHGISAITTVYTADYGLYDARDMETGYTYITNKGSNDCYVKASNFLDANISSIGNIYYTGDPKSVKLQVNGSGMLLPF
jgi:hypothetical protein